MGRMLMNYLAMKTDPVVTNLIDSDLNELKFAAKKLFNDATMLGGKGVGMSLLRWIASFAAM